MKRKQTILIVDDEMLARTGIRYMTDWESKGFRIIGEAADGQEALRIARRERPDIIITDVKMPGMDGIELTRLLRNELPQSAIYVISGFDDFRNVREAFLLGASDFLLKSELRADTLPDLLRSHFREQVAPTRSSSAQFLLLSRLEREDTDAGILLSSFQEAGVSFSQGLPYWLILGKDLPVPSDLISHLCSQIDEMEKTVAAVTPAGELCVLTQSDSSNTIHLLLQQQTEAYNSKDPEASQNLFFSCSEPFLNLSQLRSVYQKVQELSQYRFYLPEVRFLTTADAGNESVYFQRDNFLTFLAHRRFREAQELSMEYLSRCRLCCCPEPYVLKKNMEEQFILAIQALETINVPQDQLSHCKLNLLRAIDFSETLDMLKDAAENGWNQILALYVAYTDARANETLNLVQTYITAHCCEDIHLSDVAEKCFINYNYLSTLFGQTLGISFSHYLQKTRIEQAKKMLEENPSLSLAHISASVGFPDQSYFTKQFRIYEHCTPTQYVKRLQSRR